MALRRFTPIEVERYTGVPRAMVRDWRRRGLIDDRVGNEDDNGRWTYSGANMIHIALARFLADSFLDLPYAIHAAYLTHAPLLFTLVGYPDLLVKLGINREPRYAAFWLAKLGNPLVRDGMAVQTMSGDDPVELLAKARSPAVAILDFQEMMSALPADLVDLARSGGFGEMGQL